MIPFKEFKYYLLISMHYNGDVHDDFLHGQYAEFENRIKKSKGWAELRWRLANIPFDFVNFVNYDLEGLLAALDVKCHPDIYFHDLKTHKLAELIASKLLEESCLSWNNRTVGVIENVLKEVSL
jgi:hypothetical protein